MHKIIKFALKSLFGAIILAIFFFNIHNHTRVWFHSYF